MSCTKINLFNPSDFANNNISLLVGDTGIISYNGKPAYAIPQIQLYGNTFITDTLNWVKVAGLYTAHGGEQFITIGIFTDDAHTDTLRVKPGNSGGYAAGYYMDDVSVIPLDSMQLKADAGRDTTIVKGDSVWIGSRLCGLQNVVWYDAGGNVIDTGVPGLWVKPTTNTFYVIEQNVCGQYSRDTVNINVQPLPVTLLSFNVSGFKSFNGNTNTLVNWETATEMNVSHFNVQRSTDGVMFFTIGKVNAKGASKYSYIDNTNLTGIVYYRLEIVDKNGAISYSEVKEINVGDDKIKVFPNPTNGIINIEFPENEKGSWQLSLKDIYGKTNKEITISEGSHTGIMKIEGSSGIYILNVLNINTGKQEIVKVILQ